MPSWLQFPCQVCIKFMDAGISGFFLENGASYRVTKTIGAIPTTSSWGICWQKVVFLSKQQYLNGNLAWLEIHRISGKFTYTNITNFPARESLAKMKMSPSNSKFNLKVPVPTMHHGPGMWRSFCWTQKYGQLKLGCANRDEHSWAACMIDFPD